MANPTNDEELEVTDETTDGTMGDADGDSDDTTGSQDAGKDRNPSETVEELELKLEKAKEEQRKRKQRAKQNQKEGIKTKEELEETKRYVDSLMKDKDEQAALYEYPDAKERMEDTKKIKAANNTLSRDDAYFLSKKSEIMTPSSRSGASAGSPGRAPTTEDADAEMVKFFSGESTDKPRKRKFAPVNRVDS